MGFFGPARAADSAARPTYTFAVVPQFEQRKLFRIWRPILNELERRTGFRFELKGTPKIPAFERRFIAGDFDFAYMNPYHMLEARNSQGYRPLVRDGARELKGIIVVRKDSPIRSVSELDGMEVAFPSPNALGASLLVRSNLMRSHGVRVEPRYVQTHTSVYLHVAKGLIDAGGGVRTTFDSQRAALRGKLRVLHTTPSVVPHPIAAHPRVPAEHQARVQQALLAMGATPEGARLLAKVPIRRIVATSIKDYEPVVDWNLDEFYIEDWESPNSRFGPRR